MSSPHSYYVGEPTARFERLPGGEVRVTIGTESSVIAAGSWASAVAEVSAYRETRETFASADRLHRGVYVEGRDIIQLEPAVVSWSHHSPAFCITNTKNLSTGAIQLCACGIFLLKGGGPA